jgi:hypothetical protein
MRPHTRLIPLNELVLEPERAAPQRFPAGDRPAGPDDPFSLVLVTPEKRVLAGHASLQAYRASGQNLIPCRVATAEEIDLWLTRIHNRILFEDLPGEQLDAHLDLYTGLCLYRRSCSALNAAGSGIPSGEPDPNRESPSGSPGEDPGPAPSDAGRPALPTGPYELRDWHQIEPFWFF